MAAYQSVGRPIRYPRQARTHAIVHSRRLRYYVNEKPLGHAVAAAGRRDIPRLNVLFIIICTRVCNGRLLISPRVRGRDGVENGNIRVCNTRAG